MLRRILATGLGGVGGLVLWYFLIFPLIDKYGRPSSSSILAERLADRVTTFGMYSLVLTVLVCGVIVMVFGEQLRLIPTQEQVDNKQKPVSLFAADAPKGESGAKEPQTPGY